MPRRLNRKDYGWSYTFGKGQREPSESFKDGYDKINWNHLPMPGEFTRKTRFGVAKVKVFE